MDSHANLLVTDSANHKIRKISPEGSVSTIAGGEYGYGEYGYQDGLSAQALFRNPDGICIDKADNVYVADSDNHKIRKISAAGVVSTISGRDRDKEGADFEWSRPYGICLDEHDNLVVADSNNHRIRVVVLRDPKKTQLAMFCLKNIPAVELPSELVSHIAYFYHFSG